jgi:2-polyprenyl-6-methoxyphenol hydroxylase-like FAD-dependent oxidoreductase
VEEKFDVVVVGGGLAGLTLASALSDAGHPTAVLEARKSVTPVKRAMSLAPNGLEVLEKLHLLSDIEAIGRKIRVVKYLKIPGELLVAYDYSLLGGTKKNYLLAFLPHELEWILRKRAEEKQVKIYEGASFDAFLRENGQVSGVRATVDGARLNLTSKVVVGADGGRSMVRQAAGIRANSEQYKSSYLVTVADAVGDSQAEATHYLARGRMLGNFPLRHGRYLFYYLREGTFESLKANGLERFKMELSTLAPELTGCLEAANSWNDFSYLIPQEARVDSWVADHVALVGDAAHSIEPSLGQGGSLALSDVDALLPVLDICFAKSNFSATALKTYEAARRPQTEMLQRMAELTATLMNTHNGVVEWLRDRTMRRMQRNRRSMMLALETASGMKRNIGLTDKLRLAGFL